MTINRLLTWFASNWFPVLTMFGFALHASYTVGTFTKEFDSIKVRLSALESVTKAVPEISWRVTNAETSRLELRADIARVADKQDIIDAKLNRILGALESARKVAIAPNRP